MIEDTTERDGIAHAGYGRGNCPARLNDSNDFAQTDIEPALKD